MKRIMLNAYERLTNPCLFAPHWSVAHCDHAMCSSWVNRSIHEKNKAKRLADAP